MRELILRSPVISEYSVTHLHLPLSSAVCSAMLAEQGLTAPDLRQHQTLGKLRASDYQ